MLTEHVTGVHTQASLFTCIYSLITQLTAPRKFKVPELARPVGSTTRWLCYQ